MNLKLCNEKNLSRQQTAYWDLKLINKADPRLFVYTNFLDQQTLKIAANYLFNTAFFVVSPNPQNVDFYNFDDDFEISNQILNC